MLLRKEVIQPHLPIRLPCYDFTPVTAPAFDRFDSGFGRERLPVRFSTPARVLLSDPDCSGRIDLGFELPRFRFRCTP